MPDKTPDDVKVSKQSTSDLRILLTALLLGVGGALFIYVYINNTIFDMSGGRLTTVLYTSRAIESGTVIQPDMLKTMEVPQKYLHINAIPASRRSLVLGQKLGVDLPASSPLTWGDIELPGEVSLAQRLGPNERAVNISPQSGQSEVMFIRPGDRIDIIATMTLPSRGGGNSQAESVSRVLLQNVVVLAVDGMLETTPVGDETPETTASKKKSSVQALRNTQLQNAINTLTLKVTPEEANMLAFAQNHSDLMISLRGRSDVIVAEVPEVTQADLLRFNSAAEAQARGASLDGFPTIIEGGVNRGNAAVQGVSAPAGPATAPDAKARLQQLRQLQTPTAPSTVKP